jgi:hypothetical protein
MLEHPGVGDDAQLQRSGQTDGSGSIRGDNGHQAVGDEIGVWWGWLSVKLLNK